VRTDVQRTAIVHSGNATATRLHLDGIECGNVDRQALVVAADRLHNHEITAEVCLLEALLQVTEVAAHERTNIGVRDHG